MALENNEKAATDAANGKTLNQLRIILIEQRPVWKREIYYRFYGARTDNSLLLLLMHISNNVSSVLWHTRRVIRDIQILFLNCKIKLKSDFKVKNVNK